MSAVLFDLVGFVMAYEDGELSQEEVIEGFSELIKSGVAWSLQGSYGRMAMNLISAGYLNQAGEIL